MSNSNYFTELATLLHRLPPHDEKYVQLQQLLKNIESGDFAEQYVKTMLEQTDPQAIILTDLYLSNTQIDCLYITSTFCLVLEVKNIKGKVRITSTPRQMLREDTIFQSPEAQLDRIQLYLSAFLQKHSISCPLYYAISFPYHNAEISYESKKYPLLIGKDLLYYIAQLQHQQQTIPHQRIAQLIQEKSKKEYRPQPLCERYKIHHQLIKTGVSCPSCQHIPMQRLNRTWSCPACGVNDNKAHEQALKQYALLFGNRITNRECIQFLHLRNRQEATRILQNCCASRHGNIRNSYYTLHY